MYLVGKFERESSWTDPMSLVGKIEVVTKDHLVKARQDEGYQVIDLSNLTYYDPDQNRWVDIKSFDKED